MSPFVNGYSAARLLLTRITPPTIKRAENTFCQVMVSIPAQMLMTAAIMGCR